jgi:hypothetical protein
MATQRTACPTCEGTILCFPSGRQLGIHRTPCTGDAPAPYVPRASFTAPTTSYIPRAVGLAIQRLRDAYLLPLLDGDQHRDDGLGQDARLLLVWSVEADQPLPTS